MKHFHLKRLITLIMTVIFIVVCLFMLRVKVPYLSLGEPIIVSQENGTNDTLSWGYFQFPKLYRSRNDEIVCRVAYKPDSMSSYDGQYLYFSSNNNGESWEESDGNSAVDYSVLMDNGCYFQGAVLCNAYESKLLDKYRPDFSLEDRSFYMFDSDNVSEKDYDFSFRCIEYDPTSNQTLEFSSKFIWPHMPICIVSGLTYPSGLPLYHHSMHASGSIVGEKGSLFLAAYSEGFDEGGNVVYGNHYNVYFFRSYDNGRTWNYVSQINTLPKFCDENQEGFCEPSVIKLSDDNYFVLMRTGSGEPMYCAYSYDKGETWSGIRKFSDVGVDPQILRLKCGVTLASYGRPGIFLRMSDDEKGVKWNQEKTILRNESENMFTQSCSYTSLLELDEDEALMAYSEFLYPDGAESNNIAKRIVVRKITIKYRWEWR